MSNSLIVIYSILLISASCQLLTVKKQVNLQPNEPYTLQLDRLYQFPVTEIEWPKNLPIDQINSPYQRFDEGAFEAVEYEYLSEFVDNKLNIHYYLGLQRQTDEIYYNYTIVYYQIEIERSSGVLKKTEIDRAQILSNTTSDLEIYASFYNKNSGFITYAQKSQQITCLVRFENIHEEGLQLAFVSNDFFGYHSSREYIDRYSNRVAFLVTQNADNVIYQKYDFIKNSIVQNYYAVFNGTLMTNYNEILAFGRNYDGRASIKILKFIKTYLELKVDCQVFPQVSKETKFIGFQKINNLLIVTGQDKYNGTTYFVRMNTLETQHRKEYEIQDVLQLPFLIKQVPKFINEEYCTVFMGNTLSIINILSGKISFEILMGSPYNVSLNEQINNQFFLYKFQDSKSVAIPIKVQSPSINLNSLNSISYNMNVKTNFQVSTALQIHVNISTELVPNFDQVPNLFWKFVTTSDERIYQYIPMEKYASGFNLNPQVKYDRNLFNTLEIRQTSQPVKIDIVDFSVQSNHQVYQTDGMFPTLFITKVNNDIKMYAPLLSDKIFLFNITLDSPVVFIDNFGTFITSNQMASPKKTIQFPMLIPGCLESQPCEIYIDHLSNFECNSDIQFASFPPRGFVFILCEDKIHFLKTQSGFFTITTTQVLDFNFTDFHSLICIKDTLFVYSDSQIVSFNYVREEYGSTILQIPQLSANKYQKIVLFHDSFVIFLQDDPVTDMIQYSYGDFMRAEPVYLRKLFIDKNHPINPSLNFIPKRNDTEYLYIATTIKDEYVMYRMNKQFYSQNQLYSVINLPYSSASNSVVSTEYICYLSDNNNYDSTCSYMLDQASLSFNLKVEKSFFHKNLVFDAPFSIQTGDYTQNFNMKVVRNATIEHGIIDEQNHEILLLHKFLENNKLTKKALYKLNDLNAFSGCILGWRSDYFMFIQEKLEYYYEYYESFVTRVIMNNLKVKVNQQSIIFGNGLAKFISERITTDCIVLDDQASKRNINDDSYSIDVYIFCSQKMITLGINYTISNKEYTSLVIRSLRHSELVSSIDYKSFTRIISGNNQLWLYQDDSLNGNPLVQNPINGQIEVFSNTDLSSPFQKYVIDNNQVELDFYRNGLIRFKVKSNLEQQPYSIHSLQELLQSQGFYMSENHYIASIQQMSDNLFRIQINDYFVFELEFDFDYNNNRLTAKYGYLFYYKDSFTKVKYSVIAGNQTVIVGIDDCDHIKVILFNYQNQLSQQLKIESSLNIYIEKKQCVTITFAEIIEEDRLIIHLSNGYYYLIDIHDSMGLMVSARPLGHDVSTIKFFLQPLNSKHDQLFSFEAQFENTIINSVNNSSLTNQHPPQKNSQFI